MKFRVFDKEAQKYVRNTSYYLSEDGDLFAMSEDVFGNSRLVKAEPETFEFIEIHYDSQIREKEEDDNENT